MKIIAVVNMIKGMAFFRNEKFVGSLLIILEYLLTVIFTSFRNTIDRIVAISIVPTISMM